jgi:hypothetical protein
LTGSKSRSPTKVDSPAHKVIAPALASDEPAGTYTSVSSKKMLAPAELARPP